MTEFLYDYECEPSPNNSKWDTPVFYYSSEEEMEKERPVQKEKKDKKYKQLTIEDKREIVRMIEKGIIERINAGKDKCQICFVSDITECRECEICERKICTKCFYNNFCCHHSLKTNKGECLISTKIAGYKDVDLFEKGKEI